MSESPIPSIPPDTVAIAEAWALVLSLGLLLVLSGVFVFALLRAARYPHPSSLVVALSLLTFIGIAGYIATSQTDLATLAAAGIGALAGAVTAQLGQGTQPRTPESPPPKKKGGDSDNPPAASPDDEEF